MVAGWEELYGGEGGSVWGAVFISCVSDPLQKCSICYSVACLRECVAEVVFVVQSSQTL